MMRVLWIFLPLFMVALICPTLRADEPTGGQPGAMMSERIQDLNLTDEQESKVAEIRKEFKPKVEEAAKELSALVKEERESRSAAS